MKKLSVFLLMLFVTVGVFARGQKDAPVILESDGPQYVSPNNDGTKDTAVLGFTVKVKLKSLAGYIPKYGIQVINKDGEVVNEIEGKEKRDISGIEALGRDYEYFEMRREIMWDLHGEDGNLVPDGEYVVRVWVEDDSKNRSELDIEKFIVDTEAPKPELAFENGVDSVCFSPKGDRKTVKILVNGQQEALWVYQIVDKDDEPVLTKRVNDVALTEFVWDGCDDNGKMVPDGLYAFKVMGEDYAGNKSEPCILAGIQVDNRPTKIKASSDYIGFSPNADGKRDTLDVNLNYQLDTDFVSWSWRIEKLEGPIEEEVECSHEEVEEPTMKSGDVVSMDEPLNETTETVAEEATEEAAIERVEEEEEELIAEATSNVENKVVSEEEFRKPIQPDVLPTTITLNGKDEKGNVLEDGYYQFVFTAEYKNGNIEEAKLPFLIDTKAPVVDMKSVANPFIKVKEDSAKGEYFITLDAKDEMKLSDWDMEIIDNNGSVIKMFAGEGDPSRMITWNGEVNDVVEETELYYIDFKVTDRGGNETIVRRPVVLDILLIERDGKYYLMVPNIIFGAYQFTLDSYNEEYYKKNLAALDRVVNIYKRYPTYNLVLEGHALNVYDPAKYASENKEEEKILEPLTINRAEEVKDALVEKGFDFDKVVVHTFGGTKPIFDTQDENERWKNRRVEFVMELKPYEQLMAESIEKNVEVTNEEEVSSEETTTTEVSETENPQEDSEVTQTETTESLSEENEEIEAPVEVSESAEVTEEVANDTEETTEETTEESIESTDDGDLF